MERDRSRSRGASAGAAGVPAAIQAGRLGAKTVLVESGLADHGWCYVNIDDFWQNNQKQGASDKTLAGPARREDGTIVPNARFPDMKGLADYIHAKGLRVGAGCVAEGTDWEIWACSSASTRPPCPDLPRISFALRRRTAASSGREWLTSVTTPGS